MEPNADRLLLLINLRRWREAEEYIRECIAHDPDCGYWHTQFAIVVLEDRRRWKEALRAAEVGVGKNIQNGFAHMVHGLVLTRLKRFREALRAIDESLRLNHFLSTAYILKASILSARGQHRQALTIIHHGLALEPNNAELLAKQAWLEMQMARFTAARRSAESALEEEPNDATLLNTLGCVHLNEAKGSLRPFYKVKRFREAEQAFREALRHDPTDRAVQENRYQNSHYARMYLVRLTYYIVILSQFVLRWILNVALTDEQIAPLDKPLKEVLLWSMLTFPLSLIVFTNSGFAMALPLAWLGFPRVPEVKAEPPVKSSELVSHYDFDPAPPKKPARPWWKSNAALIGGLILGFTVLLRLMLGAIR